MILSETTLNVLKNFSSINPGILFRPGNTVRSISAHKTVLAKAEVDNTFDKECAIYDLSRFISALSLFDKPEVTFGDNSVSISSDQSTLKYVYADPASIVTAPTSEFALPAAEVTFTLKADDLSKVQRGGAVLQLPEIIVSGDGNTITLSAANTKNPTVDGFSIVIGSTDKTFNVIFKSENLKMMQNDYTVELTSKRIAKFDAAGLTYWIAMETASSFA